MQEEIEPGDLKHSFLGSRGNREYFFPRVPIYCWSRVGVCPPAMLTDETAALYLAFLGPLLCTSFASQLPEIVKPACRTVTASPCLVWAVGLGSAAVRVLRKHAGREPARMTMSKNIYVGNLSSRPRPTT